MAPSRAVLAGAAAAGTGAVAGVAAFAAGRRRFDRRVAEDRERLLGAAERPSGDPVTDADLAGLPDPIRRHLERALPRNRRHARTARIRQTGELKLRDEWRELTAEQHVAVDPPGFVWDASVRLLPGVGVRVCDAYVDGEGSLQARALGSVPVASAAASPEMDEAELQRYLAEAVWVPTALLPAAGVEWEAVDDDTARATLTHGGTTASLTFEVDDWGLVERVHADRRYRQEDDDFAPWTGTFGGYETHAGVLVPTEAEVAWDPPRGDGPYWRATVDAVAYDVGID